MSLVNMSDIRGMADVISQVEAAVARGENILFRGPLGSCATMIARRIPGIMPPMSLDEQRQVRANRSQARLTFLLEGERPFRAPHHSCSISAFTGVRLMGGREVPGEVTLASRGVLFLDDLPEFRMAVIEEVFRGSEVGTMVVAYAALCPCGMKGTTRTCSCTPEVIERFEARVGAFSGGFQTVVDAPYVTNEVRREGATCTSSEVIQARVVAARRAEGATP